MGRRLQLRQVTAEEEQQTVGRRARSRTASVRTVERAQVAQVAQAALGGAAVGAAVEEIAVQLHVARNTVSWWLHRFEERGLAGLEDEARGGRPPTYTREPLGEIVATALSRPQSLGLPFHSWTLDRLQAYLAEAQGIAMKRSRRDEALVPQGVRWRKEETWFGERVDPEFAPTRGR